MVCEMMRSKTERDGVQKDESKRMSDMVHQESMRLIVRE
jgi:hypothetical protein